jgi:hypothetical protein
VASTVSTVNECSGYSEYTLVRAGTEQVGSGKLWNLLAAHPESAQSSSEKKSYDRE